MGIANVTSYCSLVLNIFLFYLLFTPWLTVSQGRGARTRVVQRRGGI